MPTTALFTRLAMHRTTDATFDAALADPHQPKLTILFLWGINCPNCEVAKQAMQITPERYAWPDVRWLHANVYEDPAMATRFGVHGIPVFLVFQGRRPAGRITGWPGSDACTRASERQRQQTT